MWSSPWPLDLFQYVHIYHVLESPEVDTVLQTWLHKDWIGWKNHFPGTAGYTHAGIRSTSPVCPCPSLPQKHDADLCLACPLGPRAFCKASFYPAVNPPLWLHGIMQDLTLPYFIELHRIPVKPLLQSVRVPKFNNSPAFIQPGLVLSAREHAVDRSSNWLTIGTFYFDCNSLRLAVHVNSYIVHLPGSYLSIWIIMVL